MNKYLDGNKPIFIQIREIIEDQIVNGQLKEDEQAPSTNQLSGFYKINHATVTKGINQLVDEGILYKKRGIGMFVAEGAKKKLMEKRKEAFMNEYVEPMVLEASKIGISSEDIINLIKKIKIKESEI